MEESDYSYKKVQRTIDQEEPVKERENPLEDASLVQTSLFWPYQSLRKVKKILKVWPLTQDQIDYTLKELAKSENYITWLKKMTSNCTFKRSEEKLPKKKVQRRN